jgi:Phage portal protein, SPP1 Gp6-like
LLFDPRGIEQAIKLLEVLKSAMHEMTGVPKTALGEEQAISNTSGVALAIQYQPLMNRFHLKSTQYGEGFTEVNRLALKTLFMKEPETLTWNGESGDPPMRDDSLPMLDPMDPVTYENTVHFQPPLPVDKLVLLNELQVKMALGLESKRGAMEELGEEFPDEKLEELFKELLADAEQQAALEMLKAQVASLITNMTGMVSPEGPQPMPPPPQNGGGNGKKNGTTGDGNTKSAGGPQVNTAPAAKIASAPGLDLKDNADVQKMFQRIVTMAHGTTIPQRRIPEEDES